ncbi:helix-turn-helix domain-containing protein [Candidatus Bipolaricaulota bacterium]|nr:helix-turn-helix domain-containing protein [Candidatus Bipolaricaulota bacterium]
MGVLRPQKLAEKLSISEEDVKRLLKEREIECYKVGNQFYVTESWLQAHFSSFEGKIKTG